MRSNRRIGETCLGPAYGERSGHRPIDVLRLLLRPRRISNAQEVPSASGVLAGIGSRIATHQRSTSGLDDSLRSGMEREAGNMKLEGFIYTFPDL